MKLLLILLALSSLANGATYTDNELVYMKAMNLLEQQIQLLRNFVTEINHAESLANTGPIWRGLSNVFTDLSGMFGSGSGGRGSGGQYFEAVNVMPPPINATELARRAQIRMEQMRRDIVEMNSRISSLISETFTPPPKDRQRPRDEDKQRDSPPQGNDQITTTASFFFSSTPQNDETNLPEGTIGFELPIRGSISTRVLKDQLYQEEYDMVSKLSPAEVGKIIKPLIAKGQINANQGQCNIAKLLDEDKPLVIEP